MAAQLRCSDTIDFTGITAPVFTPMNKDGTINTSVIPHYAEKLNECNIKRILVNGTTGEGPSLTLSERQQVVDAWATAVKHTNQKLMVQVGGAPLKDVLQLVEHAKLVKAESILCLPDLYFKPSSEIELVKYMEIIDDAAAGIPLFYYHIPMLTNVNISMEKFLEAAERSKLKNFKGIKFTSTNLEEAVRMRDVGGGKYTIFLGCDQLLAAARMMGITSFIVTTVNFAPISVQRTISLVEARDNTAAFQMQQRLNKFIRTATKLGTWVECMKEAMNCYLRMNNCKFDVGNVRLPLRTLEKQKIDEIQKAITVLVDLKSF